MSDLIELKPCPFCGGDAEHAEGKYGDGKTWHYVECVGCGATGPNLEYAAHNIDVKGYRADTWNTRALIDTTAERDEALNQLDSALHSVDVLEKRVETLLAERDALRKAMNEIKEYAKSGTAWSSDSSLMCENIFEEIATLQKDTPND